MSRHIEPPAEGNELSTEDQKYLDDRGITLDELIRRQQICEVRAADFAGGVGANTLTQEDRLALADQIGGSPRLAVFTRSRPMGRVRGRQ